MREVAAWRRYVASKQVCPNCSGRRIAVVIFGRMRIHSEELLDSLFGRGFWVDGGLSGDRDHMFHCRNCGRSFNSTEDLFGIIGPLNLSR